MVSALPPQLAPKNGIRHHPRKRNSKNAARRRKEKRELEEGAFLCVCERGFYSLNVDSLRPRALCARWEREKEELFAARSLPSAWSFYYAANGEKLAF